MNFDKVKKNFGFGCMRLPMKENDVDHAEFSDMVDYFIANGFNYFDTAHGYLGGKSAVHGLFVFFYSLFKTFFKIHINKYL